MASKFIVMKKLILPTVMAAALALVASGCIIINVEKTDKKKADQAETQPN